MSLHIVVEVLIDDAPLLIFLSAHLQEVGKEIGFHFSSIKKPELLIDERLNTDTTNGFGFVQHIIVERTFHLILGMGV